jgi:prepilin-type processing-associated H-X9-DG protein
MFLPQVFPTVKPIPSPTESPTGHHLSGANFLAADGHVKWMHTEKVSAGDAASATSAQVSGDANGATAEGTGVGTRPDDERLLGDLRQSEKWSQPFKSGLEEHPPRGTRCHCDSVSGTGASGRMLFYSNNLALDHYPVRGRPRKIFANDV